MRVSIVEKSVTLYDTEGGEARMTLIQLLELVELINLSRNEDGQLRFETLEFTV